uniref:Putative ixodes 8-cys protein n=1 Tax=Ixodes ricinus TaxID=34613 RepID=A0A0K8RF86_IXORI
MKRMAGASANNPGSVPNAFTLISACLIVWSTRCVWGQLQCYITKFTFTKKCTVFVVRTLVSNYLIYLPLG